MLICPICNKELEKLNNCYRCNNNHSFDIAKEGYVNLLIKHSTNPGDNDLSLSSRKEFLNKGYYHPLANKLSEVIDKYFTNGQSFLDAGCGTGYYLKVINQQTKVKLNYYATDIAKKGVAMTSKAVNDATCFVGNVFHLPFEDESLDGLMSVFTPYSDQEFSRIIKKNGYVISVTPGKEHLYQLKEIVYDTPYYNDEKGYDLKEFQLVEQIKVKEMIHLDNQIDIANLWEMMPYIHTTSKSNSEKLLILNEVNTLIDFLICIYRKN